MFIPLNDIKPRNIYKTGDKNCPYAYVLGLDLISQSSSSEGVVIKHEESDEIAVRFIFLHDNGRYKGEYTYYGHSYNDLGDKRFTKIVDFPVQSDKENGFYVHIDYRFKWKLTDMCVGIYEDKHLYSDNKIYKFETDLCLSSDDFKASDIDTMLKQTFSNDKFISFKDLQNGIIRYYFKNKEDYNLAKLMF